MAPSIIHPRRLFAVHPSSDPAAKKNKTKNKTHQTWRKMKRLLSLQITDGENEPPVLSRQALSFSAAAPNAYAQTLPGVGVGGGGVELRGRVMRHAVQLAVRFRRADCAIESSREKRRKDRVHTVCSVLPKH